MKRGNWIWSWLALFVVPLSCGDDGQSGVSSSSIRAIDVISSVTAPGLRIEIDWMAGHEPSASALDQLRGEVDVLVAGGYLDKPSGVSLVLDDEIEIADDPDRVWTFEELDAVLREYAGSDVSGDDVVIHVLYANGGYEADGVASFVLGFAYAGNRMVMMADSIETSCEAKLLDVLTPGVADALCDRTESNIFLHELGHLFGLVNNGTGMVEPHQDEENGAHDSNEECLMYYLNERSTIVDLIAESLINNGDGLIRFDQDCLDDMAAAIAAVQ